MHKRVFYSTHTHTHTHTHTTLILFAGRWCCKCATRIFGQKRRGAILICTMLVRAYHRDDVGETRESPVHARRLQRPIKSSKTIMRRDDRRA